jgi:hypothetical protein
MQKRKATGRKVVNIFTRKAIFLPDGGISIQQIQSGDLVLKINSLGSNSIDAINNLSDGHLHKSFGGKLKLCSDMVIQTVFLFYSGVQQ